MGATGFAWLRREGCAPAALYPPGVAVPRPLEAEALDGATLVWLPLARAEPGLRALAALPRPALPLFPARDADVPQVVEAWLALHHQDEPALREAVLQVVDDPAALRDYVAAEEALWARIYAAHPHRDGEGLYPRALAEARWLLDAVLDDAAYEARAEFLTMAALETVARELLLTVRKAELSHLRDHLRGQDTVMGW